MIICSKVAAGNKISFAVTLYVSVFTTRPTFKSPLQSQGDSPDRQCSWLSKKQMEVVHVGVHRVVGDLIPSDTGRHERRRSVRRHA